MYTRLLQIVWIHTHTRLRKRQINVFRLAMTLIHDKTHFGLWKCCLKYLRKVLDIYKLRVLYNTILKYTFTRLYICIFSVLTIALYMCVCISQKRQIISENYLNLKISEFLSRILKKISPSCMTQRFMAFFFSSIGAQIAIIQNLPFFLWIWGGKELNIYKPKGIWPW